MSKQKKVPLCVQIGHFWATTTSTQVRKCQRCPMVQRYRNGQWHALHVLPKQIESSRKTHQPPLF